VPVLYQWAPEITTFFWRPFSRHQYKPQVQQGYDENGLPTSTLATLFHELIKKGESVHSQ
jgi:hypothetical protein